MVQQSNTRHSTPASSVVREEDVQDVNCPCGVNEVNTVFITTYHQQFC